MGRRMGSKNKPKSDEFLITELTKRGYKVVTSGQDTIESEKNKNLTVKRVNPDPKIKNQGSDFQVEVIRPETRKLSNETMEVKKDKDTYTCGVKICGYTQDSPFEVCPKCGTVNKWL
jgi:rubrerythrin